MISKKGGNLQNFISQICTVLSLFFVILYTVVSLLLPETPNFFGKEHLPKELNYVIILVVFSGTMLFVLPKRLLGALLGISLKYLKIKKRGKSALPSINTETRN